MIIIEKQHSSRPATLGGNREQITPQPYNGVGCSTLVICATSMHPAVAVLLVLLCIPSANANIPRPLVLFREVKGGGVEAGGVHRGVWHPRRTPGRSSWTVWIQRPVGMRCPRMKPCHFSCHGGRGILALRAHCALLLDKVLPKEPPGTPLPDAPKFRSPQLP